MASGKIKTVLLFTIFLFILTSAGSARAGIVISQLFYDPEGDDHDPDPPGRREFIELYNNGDDPVDLSGYRIEVIQNGEWLKVVPLKSAPHEPIILPHSYFLIGEGVTFGVTPDYQHDLPLQNGNYSACWGEPPQWHDIYSPVDGVRLLSSQGYVLSCIIYNPTELEPPDLDISGTVMNEPYTDVDSGQSIARIDPEHDLRPSPNFETLTTPSPHARGALADSDTDGIPDVVENEVGSNPNDADTDDDGLQDGEELKNWNFAVDSWETNPTLADTDGDGLNDYDEVVVCNTNPRKADCDGDGLSDGDEVNIHQSDPKKIDTDGDGFRDRCEVINGKSPISASSHPVLVINELYYDAPGSDAGKEWIEFYNGEDNPINVSGFVIQASGFQVDRVRFMNTARFPADSQIDGKGFILVAESAVIPDFGVQADYMVNLRFQNGDITEVGEGGARQSPADGVRLLGIDGVVIDSVIYDEPNNELGINGFETDTDPDATAPDVAPGHSLGRVSLGVDTDSKFDWMELDIPSPGGDNTVVTPTPTVTNTAPPTSTPTITPTPTITMTPSPTPTSHHGAGPDGTIMFEAEQYLSISAPMVAAD
ncbi:MAG: lamin tail domain-containing protein, partial [bacterium]